MATGIPETDRGFTSFMRLVEFVQPGPNAAAAFTLEAPLVTRNVKDLGQLPITVESY